MLDYLAAVEHAIDKGGSLHQTIKIRKATQDLEKQLTDLLKENSVIAIDTAKKVKAADFAPYVERVQRLLRAQGLTPKAVQEIVAQQGLALEFGGGLDKRVLDQVWNKVWPDSLTVNDRVKRLSAKALEFTESTVKQGVAGGESAKSIMQKLREHFETEGIERKAAFRLAAHTTNMCYQAAQEEISIQAKFVLGIRICRADDGSETCDICAEHGGEVGGDGVEYLKADNDADLRIMSSLPPYHAYCKCWQEDIIEDAVTFIKRARAEYAAKNR